MKTLDGIDFAYALFLVSAAGFFSTVALGLAAFGIDRAELPLHNGPGVVLAAPKTGLYEHRVYVRTASGIGDMVVDGDPGAWEADGCYVNASYDVGRLSGAVHIHEIGPVGNKCGGDSAQ